MLNEVHTIRLSAKGDPACSGSSISRIVSGYGPRLSKTVITLTAVNELMYARFEVGKVLVIATLRVARSTWTQEQKKWDHLKDLRVSQILGSEKERIAGLEKEADI